MSQHKPIGAAPGRDYYQSKTITEHKHVTYDGQLRPIIVKSNLVPNAQVRQQIIHRHYEELKSSSPDSLALGNPVSLMHSMTPFY